MKLQKIIFLEGLQNILEKLSSLISYVEFMVVLKTRITKLNFTFYLLHLTLFQFLNDYYN